MVKKVARVPSFCGLTSQEKWHSATILPLWGLCLGGRQDDPRERHERPAKAEHLSLRDSLQSTHWAFQERGEEPREHRLNSSASEPLCFLVQILFYVAACPSLLSLSDLQLGFSPFIMGPWRVSPQWWPSDYLSAVIRQERTVMFVCRAICWALVIPNSFFLSSILGFWGSWIYNIFLSLVAHDLTHKPSLHPCILPSLILSSLVTLIYVNPKHFLASS